MSYSRLHIEIIDCLLVHVLFEYANFQQEGHEALNRSLEYTDQRSNI